MQALHSVGRLTRDDLDLVLAIGEEGTVSRAAVRLHLSQSALSHRLRALEDRVGSALFRRSSRRMSATQVGEMLLERAPRICAEFRDSEEALAGSIYHKKRVVRLASECYTSFHWLPALVRKMSRVSKDVELRIVIEATRRAKAALASGETDAAILLSSGEDHRFRYWNLFRDELLLVVSSQHRLAHQRAVQPQDLAAETLLLHQISGGRQAVVDGFLLPAKAQPGAVFEVQLTEAIVEMVRSRMGVTVLAGWLAEPYVRAGGLATLRLGTQGLWRNWRLATLREHRLLPTIEALSRVLSSLIRTSVSSKKRH